MAEPDAEVQEGSAQESVATAATAPITPVADTLTSPPPPSPLPQQPCPTCGSNGAAMPASYVYALGRIDPRFSEVVDREGICSGNRPGRNRQLDRPPSAATGPRAEPLSGEAALLGDDHWRARNLYRCPSRSRCANLLVETLRPNPQPGDVDLVVGMRGPLAPPEMCNGLLVPIVAFDQLYTFDRASLIASIPRPERVAAERFREAAGEVFDRIMQMTDNAGATDEHRALNYLTVRYPAIYAAVAQAQGRIPR